MSASSSRSGLHASTIALLVVILLIAAGQELSAPFMPRYISSADVAKRLLARDLLLVGVFGTLKDVMEAIYYRFGGRIGGRLGARRAYIVFTLMPILGAALVLGWASNLAPLLAVPLLSAWDSMAQPVTLTVIGATVSMEKRTLGFSLQSIQRRIPRIVGYVLGGLLTFHLGDRMGIHVALWIFIGLAALALLVILRYIRVEEKDAPGRPSPFFQSLREMPRDLKLLLISDIFARLAEGFPRELVVLYLTAAMVEGSRISQATYGNFMALNAAVSLAIYVPIGLLASKEGSGKKPYIGWTFVFFALFPISVVLGGLLGTAGLVAAFVVMGLREFGEPARKAMITELIPKDRRTELTGIYWSARSCCVLLAPFLGALAWIYVGPAAPFAIASALGALGAGLFYLRFARPPTTAAGPATPP